MFTLLSSVKEKTTKWLQYQVTLLLGSLPSIQIQLDELQEQQKNTTYQLAILRKALLEINERVADDGWTEIMQNAVQGLDGRIDILYAAAQHQQQIIEELTESRDEFWSTNLNFPSTDRKQN